MILINMIIKILIKSDFGRRSSNTICASTAASRPANLFLNCIFCFLVCIFSFQPLLILIFFELLPIRNWQPAEIIYCRLCSFKPVAPNIWLCFAPTYLRWWLWWGETWSQNRRRGCHRPRWHGLASFLIPILWNLKTKFNIGDRFPIGWSGTWLHSLCCVPRFICCN